MAQETRENCECCRVSTWTWIEVDETLFCMKCVKEMVSEIPCKVCKGGSGAFARGGGPDDTDVFCSECLYETMWDLADRDAQEEADKKATPTKKKKQKK